MAQILDLSKLYTKQVIDEKRKEANQYDEPDAGGYICKIVDAFLEPKKMYVLLHLDIAEGKYAGYYQKLEDRAGFWGLRYYASYKETVLNKFIKMCATFETCNPGFSFDPMRGGGADVDTLKGKNLGVTFGYEEYEKKDGTIGTRPYVGTFTEIKKIQNGKFKVPEKKTIQKPKEVTGSEGFMAIPEGTGNMDSIPFDVRHSLKTPGKRLTSTT